MASGNRCCEADQQQVQMPCNRYGKSRREQGRICSDVIMEVQNAVSCAELQAIRCGLGCRLRLELGLDGVHCHPQAAACACKAEHVLLMQPAGV